ncbi:cation-translocating P-type ATPase [uncultured Corynebacterium sp.]|uniref:heavy metal translocating P-type ATPase n=1 Tax=uncultured Corynebacterium sp. TaxID=159447 RepID=UPI0025924120|nr:HAD family hydrolase [uncultured Corynebacterium sp.]
MADNVTRSIDDARLAAKDAGFDPDSRHSEDSNGNPLRPHASYAFELEGLEDGAQLRDIEEALEELPGVQARLVYPTKMAWVTAPDTTAPHTIAEVMQRFGVEVQLTDSTLRRRAQGHSVVDHTPPRRGTRGMSGRMRRMKEHEQRSLRTARASGFVRTARRRRGMMRGQDVLFTARDLVTPLRMWIAIVLSIPVILMAYVPQFQFPGWQWCSLALSTPVALWCAFPFHRAMLGGVRRGISALDGASSIAILAAWLWSLVAVVLTSAGQIGWTTSSGWVPHQMGHDVEIFFEVSCAVTTLLLVGRYFTMRARPRLMEDLQARNPDPDAVYKVVRRSRAGNVTEEDFPAVELNKGDDVYVHAGEIIPADGEVVGGSGVLNPQIIDAREPSEVKVGSTVRAGSVLRSGKIKMRVERVGHTTRLGAVERWVDAVLRHQNEATLMSTRAAGLLIPAAYALAILDFGLWVLLTGNYNAGFSTALAILVVVAPVALAISPSLAIRLGIESAVRNGILIRDGETFRALESTDTAVFNRVGTLVKPQMTVETVTAERGESPEMVMRVAGALSVESNHPSARAMVKAAREARDGRTKSADVPSWIEMSNEEITPGGEFRGRLTLTYGDEDEDRTESFDACLWRPTNLSQLHGRLAMAATAGGTPVVVRWRGKDRGVITLYDPAKDDAHEAINRLEQMGVETVMLTRDTYPVARRFADFLGMSNVLAGITAPDKPGAVRAIHTKGATVAMIGDATALPTIKVADVGLLYATDDIIDAQSSTIARACNAVLIRDDVSAVPQLIAHARRVCHIIDYNMIFAWAYNSTAIVLAAIGVLPPVGATLLMLGSSLVIEAHSSRANHFPT